MDSGDYYWALRRDYKRDPFPHSQLGTRQIIRSFGPLGSWQHHPGRDLRLVSLLRAHGSLPGSKDAQPLVAKPC